MLRDGDFAVLLIGATLLRVPSPAAFIQLADKLKGPDAVVLGPRVEQLDVMANEVGLLPKLLLIYKIHLLLISL